jgi:hypothetical protein
MNHSNYCARALAAWAILLPMLAHAVPPTLGRCQVLPSDHVLNARIDDLPVHPQSADFIRTISSGSRRLHLDLGISETPKPATTTAFPTTWSRAAACLGPPCIWMRGGLTKVIARRPGMR